MSSSSSIATSLTQKKWTLIKGKSSQTKKSWLSQTLNHHSQKQVSINAGWFILDKKTLKSGLSISWSAYHTLVRKNRRKAKLTKFWIKISRKSAKSELNTYAIKSWTNLIESSRWLSWSTKIRRKMKTKSFSTSLWLGKNKLEFKMPALSLSSAMMELLIRELATTEKSFPKIKPLCMVAKFCRALLNSRKRVFCTEICVLVIYFYTMMKWSLEISTVPSFTRNPNAAISRTESTSTQRLNKLSNWLL